MEKLYDLNPSQEVVMLQTKYTLFKRVVNIIFSATKEGCINFNIMKDAFNILVKRNDCLRIRFKKVKGKVKQYFKEKVIFDEIPTIKFDSKEQQDVFIKRISKKAIKYMKGQVVEPYFIQTYDNKSMVLLKICHLIIDITGLNNLFNDLFDIYDSLILKKELPQEPSKFEDVIINDLHKKENESRHQEHINFFKEYISNHEEPYYAGIHGSNQKIWQKQLKKNKRAMKMFFINNDTIAYEHLINKDTVTKVLNFCKEYETTPTNAFFYICSLTCALLNNNVTSMLPLQLCNCRTTYVEKKCAGSKVQSIGCFTKVNYEKNIIENLKEFSLNQLKLYRRINFPDQEFEMMLHKIYPSSMLETYYSITFSFVPYHKRKDVTFNLYSNGKGALPCYLVLLYDVNSNEIRMGYDVHDKTTSKEDVKKFHELYVKLLNEITLNPNKLLKEYKING